MQTKQYRGVRDDSGQTHVMVEFSDGSLATPLPHIVRHSPTGLEWGYGGSGPADLARSLIMDALGHDVHPRVYQTFKAEIVASLDRSGFVLADADVRATVERIGAQLHVECVQCLDQGFIDAGDDTDYCSCPTGRLLQRDLEGEGVDAES
jgi:hypothetical protein